MKKGRELVPLACFKRFTVLLFGFILLGVVLTSCGGGGNGAGGGGSSTPIYNVVFFNSDQTANSATHPQAMVTSVRASVTVTFTIENKSSVPITQLAANLGTLSNLGLSATLSNDCASLDVNKSCTGTLTFAPKGPIADVSGSVEIDYQKQSGATESADFMITLSNGNDVVQGIALGTPISSINKNIKASSEVDEQVFQLSGGGTFSETTLPNVSVVDQVVGAGGGFHDSWAYGHTGDTYYGFMYNGSSWNTGQALPFTPKNLAAAGGEAFLLGEDASGNVVVYESTEASPAWTNMHFPFPIPYGNGGFLETDGRAFAFLFMKGSSSIYFYNASTWSVGTLPNGGTVSANPKDVSIIDGSEPHDTVNAVVVDQNSNVYYTLDGSTWTQKTYAGYSEVGFAPPQALTDDLFMVWQDSNGRYYLSDFNDISNEWSATPKLLSDKLSALNANSDLLAMAVGDDAYVDYFFATGVDGSSGNLYAVCTQDLSCTVNDSLGAMTVSEIAPVVNGFYLLAKTAQNQSLVYYIASSDPGTLVPISDITNLSTISSILGSSLVTRADVLGFDSSGHAAYSLKDFGSAQTSGTFPSTFMWKANHSSYVENASSTWSVGLTGIAQAQTNLAAEFDVKGTWTTLPALDSIMDGTVDNFALDPAKAVASSLSACSSTTSAICDQHTWALVTSGNTHKTIYFVNTSPEPQNSDGKGELQSVPGMVDINNVYSSLGQGFALQYSKAQSQLAVSTYDTTKQIWNTATVLGDYDSAVSRGASRIPLVAASDGQFWVAYPSDEEAGGDDYEIAYSNNGNWGVPYSVGDKFTGNVNSDVYLTSASGKAWFFIDKDFYYFDGKNWANEGELEQQGSLQVFSSVDAKTNLPIAFVWNNATFTTISNGSQQKSFTPNLDSGGAVATADGVAWIYGKYNAKEVAYVYQDGVLGSAISLPSDITSTTNAYAQNSQIWIWGLDASNNPHIAWINGSTVSEQTISGMSTITSIIGACADLMATGTDSSGNAVFATYNASTNTWSAAQLISGGIGLQNASFFPASTQ